MNSKELLQQVAEHAAVASHIATTLAAAAAAQNGLSVQQVKPELWRLNDHLRSAQCSAIALQSLAEGNPPPKWGD